MNGEKLYKGYVAIEIDTDEILRPIYVDIQKERGLEIEFDYEDFKEIFNTLR